MSEDILYRKFVHLPYLNHKKVYGYRYVRPDNLVYTGSEYHGTGWIMKAFCETKSADRDFLLTDVLKGVIMHTMKETGVVCTPERVTAVYNNIEKRYEEQKENK